MASRIQNEAKRLNDGIHSLYRYLKKQGLSPDALYRVRVMCKQSLELGIVMNVINQDKFQTGIEDELGENTEVWRIGSNDL